MSDTDFLENIILMKHFAMDAKPLPTPQHPYKREQCADRKCPRQRDTTKNHGRLGGIRQTPGYLQKQPCHLPEETGVQLLCAASYDIWCRDLDTDQTSTEQTCGRTDQNGKKYAQHHIQR